LLQQAKENLAATAAFSVAASTVPVIRIRALLRTRSRLTRRCRPTRLDKTPILI
jgi:hypothetical protein